MTAKNSNSHWYLACSGFEVYGKLYGNDLFTREPPKPSPGFAFVELTNSSPDKDNALMNTLLGYGMEAKHAQPLRTKLSIKRFSDIQANEGLMLSLYLQHKLFVCKDVDLFKAGLSVSSTTPTNISPTTTQTDSTHTMKPRKEFEVLIRTIFSWHAQNGELPTSSIPEVLKYCNHPQRQAFLDRCVAFAKSSSLKVLSLKAFRSFICTEARAPTHVQIVCSWLHGAGYDLNLIRNHDRSFDNVLVSLSKWTQRMDIELIRFVQENAGKWGQSNLLRLNSTQIHVAKEDIEVYGAISEVPVHLLRLRFTFLKRFNTLMLNLLPIIDLRRADDFASIAALVHRSRDLIFSTVTNEFFDSVLDQTSEEHSPPSIQINRLQIAQQRRKPNFNFTKDSTFAAAYHKLKDVDPAAYRPQRPHGAETFLAFELDFLGEHVVGEGGPYRQFFTDLASELMHDSCPLFIPSPNNESKLGEYQHGYIIKPSSVSSTLIHHYEFLGILFGICVRTGVCIPLKFPSMFWKALVRQPCTHADLANMDHSTAAVLTVISKCDEKQFSAINETFVVRLSDKTCMDLKENGSNIKVVYSNRMEYVHLVRRARLQEHKQQIDAIRRGMARVIPIQLLNILNWQKMKIFVCGKDFMDIALLRRHTRYSACLEDDPHIVFFWDVLSSFNQNQRKRFIQFAWAQETLPADDTEFVRTHTRFMIKPCLKYPKNQDGALPRADTCFFNLELPKYSSKAIMRKKLLYALSVMSMNADEVCDTWLCMQLLCCVCVCLHVCSFVTHSLLFSLFLSLPLSVFVCVQNVENYHGSSGSGRYHAAPSRYSRR